MNLISRLKPSNLLEEKNRFLSDHSYNPQFVYSAEIHPSELTQWGTPQPKFVAHSQEMLLARYDPQKVEELPTSKKTAIELVTAFNTTFPNLKPIEVSFDPTLISGAKINLNKLILAEPLRYSDTKIKGLINHELGTHHLRRVNHLKHFKQSSYSENTDFRKTEEGLANLHGHLCLPDKTMYHSYLNYLAVDYGQKHSFAELFRFLRVTWQVPTDKAWNTTLRVKRGLMDTSQPGAMTKAICYLEGAVKLARWITTTDQDLRKLYWGKLSLQSIFELRLSKADLNDILIPSFLREQDKYRNKINEIIQYNRFDQLYD